MAAEEHFAGEERVDAEDRLGRLAAAGADESGEADDLAFADGEGDVVHAGGLKAARLEEDGAGRRVGSRRIVLRDLASDHVPDERGGVEAGGGRGEDDGAVAQHADVVREREDLLEAVGDVDDRNAACAQVAHDAEEAHGLGLGEGGRGLVHHDEARAAVDRLEELHELALRGGERGDRRERVERKAVALRQFADDADLRILVHAAQRPAYDLAAEEDVLEDREVAGEVELLVEHRDAGGEGVGRAGEAALGAVEDDAPGVRRVDAGENLHQRRLAGAVLAAERADRPAPHRERDVRERDDRRELLADAFHPQNHIVLAVGVHLNNLPLKRRSGRVGRRGRSRCRWWR